MRPANERRRYNVTSSLIGWAYTQNDSWIKQGSIVWDQSALKSDSSQFLFLMIERATPAQKKGGKAVRFKWGPFYLQR